MQSLLKKHLNISVYNWANFAISGPIIVRSIKLQKVSKNLIEASTFFLQQLV